MIKLNYLFEKNAIHSKSESVVSLIQILGEKENTVNEKRKLNLSISIDVSGSMGSAIKTQKILKTRKVLKKTPHWFNKPGYIDILNGQINPLENVSKNHWNQPEENEYIEEQYYDYVSSISKLEQAKNAAIKAVEKMNIGDYISIVCFDDEVKVLVEATKINNKNKKDIISKIKSITVGGSTNLHEGWLRAATEVAKNISEKFVNRVIVLTDGQANVGIVNPTEIENNIFKLSKKSISTTCMGIGEGFNEKLLESMSNAGSGNFYFIENDSELETMFNDEFAGLSNVVGTDVKMKFIPVNATIKQQLNLFVEKEGEYLLTNIFNGKTLDVLFEFNVKVKKNQKNIEIGKILLSYTNESGKLVHKEIELVIPVVSKETYDNMEYNKEVKVQETLMIVANNKFEMASAIERGDLEYAKGLMAASANVVGSTGYVDDRLMKESATLNATLSSTDNMSSESLKKSILYQSYQTRNSK